jgi:cytochrome c oxidase subunit II
MTLLPLEVAVRTTRCCVIGAAVCALAACDGPQSALISAGRDAEHIAELFRVMALGAAIAWLAVVAIAVYSIRARGPHNPRVAGLLILGGGVATPTIVLGALLAYGMPLVPRLTAGADEGPSIQVTAKQWWWRVQYRTADGLIETANELRLPVGRRVELELGSPDVIHSFWVPSLAGKMDMIPGRVTRLALEPTQTGTFRGACAEYCGAAHALMAFSVVVMEPAAFRAWLEEQGRPAQPPGDSLAGRGETAFIASGCTACHTIRGTPAAGVIGPDLTHVGSRNRIGAETLPNDRFALAHWISRTDTIKPGVHMPAFRSLGSDDLTALAAYLGGLR